MACSYIERLKYKNIESRLAGSPNRSHEFNTSILIFKYFVWQWPKRNDRVAHVGIPAKATTITENTASVTMLHPAYLALWSGT